MRVLFVAPYIPSRIRVRSHGFVRHLAQRHEVTVLALESGERTQAATDDIEDLRRAGAVVTIIQEPRYQPYLRTLHTRLALTGAPLPLQVAFAAAPRLRRAIATELSAGRYDVLHVEHVRGLGALPVERSTPVVWDAVDCVSLLFEEAAHLAATPMTRILGWHEARLLRTFERRQIMRFPQMLTTSARDRQALLDLAGALGDGRDAPAVGEITVLPHGLDIRHAPLARTARRPKQLIFSGKMDYHANVAAALLLAERILPLIWQSDPQVRLTIAGNNPPQVIRQLARDARITVTGYVADLDALIATAVVAVCPLPYAVGIQNKALEAMADGTPVVASGSAACGLQAAIPGRDLLVADAPEAFAAAVLRLLADPVEWTRLAEYGARYVAAYHNWDTIIGQLTEVYARAQDATIRSRPTPLAEPRVLSAASGGRTGSVHEWARQRAPHLYADMSVSAAALSAGDEARDEPTTVRQSI